MRCWFGIALFVVALGAKKGQAWIEHNQSRIKAPVISHLGAVVNFTAEPAKDYTIEEYHSKTHELLGKKKVKYAATDYGTGAIYRRVPARKEVAKEKPGVLASLFGFIFGGSPSAPSGSWTEMSATMPLSTK
jgi:hypothetical protein